VLKRRETHFIKIERYVMEDETDWVITDIDNFLQGNPHGKPDESPSSNNDNSEP
jgi:hypothetical protein